MPRQRLVAILFILASVAAVTGWVVFERVTNGSTAGTGKLHHPLVDEKGVGVIYKLDPKLQDMLIKAVEHFCVKKYHRESCVHHLSTCGNPCLVAVPKDQRIKIFNDYQRLRKAQGLPMLLKMPAIEDDETEN